MNGSLPRHDYSHPKCFKKRLTILDVLFKLNPNPATQLDMNYFERKVIHELMVNNDKWIFPRIHLWMRLSSNGVCNNLQKYVEKCPNVSSFIFSLAWGQASFRRGGLSCPHFCDIWIIVLSIQSIWYKKEIHMFGIKFWKPGN